MQKQIVLTQPKVRAIAESEVWNNAKLDEQYDAVRELRDVCDTTTPLKKCILTQLRKKIAGYKSQDMKKKLYDAELIMDVSGVLGAMVACDFGCYYCKDAVIVLYENIREPKQWTLERLDNSRGHNRDNVVIACLQCNLTRKTMYHERFMFTKQLDIVKKDS
jgi:hypothetical protein